MSIIDHSHIPSSDPPPAPPRRAARDETGPSENPAGDLTELGRRFGCLRFLREVTMVVITALALVIIIKTFFLQAFYIPTLSMFPTLGANERVLVSKVAFTFDEPGPGDVIVFKDPAALPREETFFQTVRRNILEALGLSTSDIQDLIKRVIAVEGDRVGIRGNQVMVNGTPIQESYLNSGFTMADQREVIVPAGHVWVLGDNRNNSFDSRRFGPVPLDDVVGRAFLRLWPLGRLSGL